MNKDNKLGMGLGALLSTKTDPSNKRGTLKINISQIDHLFDDQGKIAVKYIGRFENLQNEFDIITDKIGVERITLPHKKKYLGEKNYKDFYSKELRLFVEKKLEKELQFLNYKF